MSLREYLSFAIGGLEVALGLLVLRHLGRFGRAFPWLAALMAFFILRGIDRIYLGFFTAGEFGLDVLLDGLVVIVVVLLIVGLDKTIRTLRASEDAATHRQIEYERALVDYRRLARHRLANPLAAIQGSIASLRELDGLDDDTRAQLLENVAEHVQRLKKIALEPTTDHPEERMLNPAPKIGEARDLLA